MMSRYISFIALFAFLIACAVGGGLYLEMPLSAHRELRADGDVRVYQCDHEGKLHGTEYYYFPNGSIHMQNEYYHGARTLGAQYWPSGRLMFRWREGPNYTGIVENYLDVP